MPTDMLREEFRMSRTPEFIAQLAPLKQARGGGGYSAKQKPMRPRRRARGSSASRAARPNGR